MNQEILIDKQFSVLMQGYTVDDIIDISYVKFLYSELCELFDHPTIQIPWLDADHREFLDQYDQLTEDQLKKIYERGAIALIDHNSQFNGGLSWNRISKLKTKKYLKETGYRQNHVDLRVHSDNVKDESFCKRFRTFVKNIAIHLNVTYLYVYIPLKQDGAFCSQNGLGVGLKDVYWINIFGQPYLRMIGKEKLLECPVGHVEECGQDHVLIQTSDLPLNIDHDNDRRMVEHIRDYIGGEYFTKKIVKTYEEKSGVISIWEFIRFLWRTRGEFKDTSYHADVCPEFDWKNIFVDE